MPATLTQLQALRDRAEAAGRRHWYVTRARPSFVFSAEPGGSSRRIPTPSATPSPRPGSPRSCPKDLHLHSLRHFQATSLDTVIPERQKQARLGWSTVHMARHYTDAISSEDQKAAEHIGSLLDP